MRRLSHPGSSESLNASPAHLVLCKSLAPPGGLRTVQAARLVLPVEQQSGLRRAEPPHGNSTESGGLSAEGIPLHEHQTALRRRASLPDGRFGLRLQGILRQSEHATFRRLSHQRPVHRGAHPHENSAGRETEPFRVRSRRARAEFSSRPLPAVQGATQRNARGSHPPDGSHPPAHPGARTPS